MTMQYVCGVNQKKLETVIEETENLVDFLFDEIVKKISNLGFMKPGCYKNSVKREIYAVSDGRGCGKEFLIYSWPRSCG